MASVIEQRDLLLAATAGVAAVAGSYLAAGWSRSFVVSPLDQAIVNLTPGPIVTVAIETIGNQGHLLHVALAIAVAISLFGSLSVAGKWITAQTNRLLGAAVAGSGSWLLAVGLTGAPAPAIGAAFPVAAITALGGGSLTSDGEQSVDAVRRRVLRTVSGSFVFAVAAVIGRQALGATPGAADSDPEPLPDAPRSGGAEMRLEELDAASLAVESDDLLGMMSPIGEFYTVDIAQFDPEITAAEWSLTFTGETGSERTVTFDDLIDRPVEHRVISLRCVGEQLNGRKLDTAVWTGTPIQPLIESVDPAGDCNCAMVRGEDGYYVQFPVDVLADGFLAWGMNGKALPTGHGYPVRVLIPGHWGETNVKWLSEIELLNIEEDGYWEERGWEGTGEVKTIAKLWDEGITELPDGQIELAGHAYAGTRGIKRVEVSIDGGDSWTDAMLSDPLPDVDVWRQWQHVFDPDGTHEVVVRAIDGEGNKQVREASDPSPSGSSGWVRRTVG